MKKYLLREFFPLCPNNICEDMLTESERLERQNGTLFLTGVAQRANQKNGNGRIYPTNTLQREVANYQHLIKERRALGELDHPDQAVINLQNASHMITEIWWQGNDVMVKLKVLSTPAGQTLRSLVNDGVAIGLSSRGLGSVTETKNGLMVEDDFQLICFDCVSEPSTQGAFMNLMEAKIHPSLEKEVFNKQYRIRRAINDILKR